MTIIGNFRLELTETATNTSVALPFVEDKVEREFCNMQNSIKCEKKTKCDLNPYEFFKKTLNFRY